MNQETHRILREIIRPWLLAPERDLEDAIGWCARYLARLPYSLIDANPEEIAWQAAGCWRSAHRDQLHPFVRAFTG